MIRPEGGPGPEGAAARFRILPTLSIVGPTASGKSHFALDLAQRLGGIILSCDSMAVYRGLDIGTAKATPQERARVPHFGLDLAEPGESFSAGAFRAYAVEVIAEQARLGRPCIVVGGTGLYYRALTAGLADLPPRDEELRARLHERSRRRGKGSLHVLLRRLDPVSASRIMPADAVRLNRALEVRLITGRPLSAWIASSPFSCDGGEATLAVGLSAPRDALYARIDARVDAMMAAGFLGEVASLLARGVLAGPARKAIGYGELADHIEGRISIRDAVETIKLRSRHLAKRQMTWFRRESGIRWYDTCEEAWEKNAGQLIERWLQEAGPRA